MGRRKIGGSAKGQKASKPNLVAAALELAGGPYAVAGAAIGLSVNQSMASQATARRAELARLFRIPGWPRTRLRSRCAAVATRSRSSTVGSIPTWLRRHGLLVEPISNSISARPQRRSAAAVGRGNQGSEWIAPKVGRMSPVAPLIRGRHAFSTRAVCFALCGFGWQKYGVTRMDSIDISKLGIRRDDTFDLDFRAEMSTCDSFHCVATLHRI
jgi:hypothetical protein